MESGLEDRNNACRWAYPRQRRRAVSMESGLEDRNNQPARRRAGGIPRVSMESGLEDRNNKGYSRP